MRAELWQFDYCDAQSNGKRTSIIYHHHVFIYDVYKAFALRIIIIIAISDNILRRNLEITASIMEDGKLPLWFSYRGLKAHLL